VPYLEELAGEAARTGLPLIRPMVLAFPADERAALHRYQYMLGPDLLVAPIYQPGTRRSVYLPAGEWYDYFSGRRHSGPIEIEAEAPLDRMPLFVRAGAVIEMLPPDVDTLVPRHRDMAADVVAVDQRRVLHVWPERPQAIRRWRTASGMAIERSADGAKSRLRLSSVPAREVTVILRASPGVEIAGSAQLAADPLAAPEGARAIRVTAAVRPVELGWRAAR
jgi:hypothetical protein